MARWITYQGRHILLEDGENKVQAVSRYNKQKAKEEADRREREIAEREEKQKKAEERKKTPKYENGTIVQTKDGKYYRVWDGYYQTDGETGSVYYDAEPVTADGKLDMPDDPDDYRWSSFPSEIDQRDIQKKISSTPSNKASRDSEANKLHRQALEGLDTEWSDFGRDEQDGIPSWQYVSDDLKEEGKFSDKETDLIMSGKADYALTCRFLAFMAKREMSLNDVKGATKKSVADALSWAVDTKISDAILSDILKYIK